MATAYVHERKQEAVEGLDAEQARMLKGYLEESFDDFTLHMQRRYPTIDDTEITSIGEQILYVLELLSFED